MCYEVSVKKIISNSDFEKKKRINDPILTLD